MLPHKALLTISILPFISAQLTSLPQCIQTCITSSQPSTSCSITNISCLCLASSSSENFLPNLISCINSSCSNELDTDLVLTPLQLACQIEGFPIPASILGSAESEASSLAMETVTATATVTVSGSGSGASTTNEGAGTTTVTNLITSTPTTSAPSVTLSPVVITTTDSLGSTYTFWVSDPPPSSGIRTTWVPITIISGSSTSVDSTGGGTTSTSVAGKETSTTSAVKETSSSRSESVAGSKTSTGSGPKQTDSAPFTDTNSGAVKISDGNAWLWLGVIGGMALIWVW